MLSYSEGDGADFTVPLKPKSEVFGGRNHNKNLFKMSSRKAN